ncbi:nitroreductase family protein [Weeksellaceae bacterium TAE3-ERU29]|nr:nitroreductase family protein [Weeksellaceae bacterium TAE3-ERU29]
MESLKKILRPFYTKIIDYKSLKIYKKYDLIRNFVHDYKLYKKYSIVFSKKDIKNKEADLILHYHSLEKGMLFKNMKKGFAKYRILRLHKMLSDNEVLENTHRQQIRISYQVMCEYYELHQEKGYNIENIFPKEKYVKYKSILSDDYHKSFSGKINWSKSNFYKHNQSNFYDFAHSRKSVREFTGDKLPIDILNKVINLANTAPSVCNRQANNVYLLENKDKIDKVLKIQGGLTGYTDNVTQLLILTNDRKYYYTVGERNQLYIDGGIYLMNLLYALHYYKIGNCPANWGKTRKEERELNKVIRLPESEKIICMIPIGQIKEKFRTTLSCRRSYNENFIKLN